MRTQVSKIALGLAFLSPALGISQERIIPCHTDEAMREVFKADPQAKARFEAAEKTMLQNYQAFEASHRMMNTEGNVAAKTTALTDYTIPVVFHILHLGGSENISDQQCITALEQVNKDYARLGSDTGQIYKTFRDGTYPHTPAGYINSQITFKLAHKDPNGNGTTGIVHHYDTRTNWNRDAASPAALFGGITWPATKYLNIIIVKQIITTGSVAGGGIIVGYTYRPGTWGPNVAQDAIVYNHNYLGGMNARDLSHEIGHWLGLPHTWGGTNAPNVACGDDGIYDTPRTLGHEFTCPSSANSNNCSQGTIPTVGSFPVYAAGEDNVQNFMDYSSCPGKVMNFTTGQTYYMQSVLNGTAGSLIGTNPSSANRPNLVTASNLSSSVTAVNENSVYPIIVDWHSTSFSYTVCAGGSLQLKDYSYNGAPASWTWTAGNGATAANPTNSTTSMAFPTAGVTSVTLSVTNSAGVVTKLSKSVYVLDGEPGATTPINEGFESGLPENWTVENPDDGSAEWTNTFDAAYEGTWSYMMDIANTASTQVDYLTMPIIDMESNPDKSFSFAYSYARQTSTQTDALKVQGSKDCGATWGDIQSFNSSSMANNSGPGGVYTDPYYPASQSEWRVQNITNIDWNQYKNSPHLMIRFAFISGGNGNHLFLDAINLGGTVGLSELAKNISLSLYPNPANGEATLKFNLADASSIKVNVLDVTGRVVSAVADENFAPGEHSIAINKNNTLEKGIYFVNMTVNGKSLTRKLLVD